MKYFNDYHVIYVENFKTLLTCFKHRGVRAALKVGGGHT
jgi:hypothetical protein